MDTLWRLRLLSPLTSAGLLLRRPLRWLAMAAAALATSAAAAAAREAFPFSRIAQAIPCAFVWAGAAAAGACGAWWRRAWGRTVSLTAGVLAFVFVLESALALVFVFVFVLALLASGLALDDFAAVVAAALRFRRIVISVRAAELLLLLLVFRASSSSAPATRSPSDRDADADVGSGVPRRGGIFVLNGRVLCRGLAAPCAHVYICMSSFKNDIH
jgi:hypothetical protein